MGCVLVKAEIGACKRGECLRVTPATTEGIRVCSEGVVKCLDPQKDEPVLWKESVAEADRTVLSILSFPNKWVFCSLTRFSYSLVKEKKRGLNLVLNPARAQSCRCCAGSSYAMMKGPPRNGLSGFKSSSSELKRSIINHCKENGA